MKNPNMTTVFYRSLVEDEDLESTTTTIEDDVINSKFFKATC